MPALSLGPSISITIDWKCQTIYISRFYMLTVQSVIQRPQASVYVNQDSNILATL